MSDTKSIESVAWHWQISELITEIIKVTEMTAVIKQSVTIEKIIIFRDKRISNIVIFSSEVFHSFFWIVNRAIHLFHYIISFSLMFSIDNFHISIRDLIKLTITLSLSKTQLILQHCLNKLYNTENSYFKLLSATTSDSLHWTSSIKIFNVFLIISFAQGFNRSI